MGEIKKDKSDNIFYQARVKKFTSRSEASDAIGIYYDRLLELENGRGNLPTLDEVDKMIRGYGDRRLKPLFCHNYCTLHSKRHEISDKPLTQLSLELIDVVNQLSSQESQLISITKDGEITDDEMEDFNKILDQLSDMENTISSIKLYLKSKKDTFQ